MTPPRIEEPASGFAPMRPRNGRRKEYGKRARIERDEEEEDKPEDLPFWKESDVNAECIGAANYHIKHIRRVPLTPGLTNEQHAIQQQDMPLQAVLQRMARAHFEGLVPAKKLTRLLRLEEKHAHARNAYALGAEEASKELDEIASSRKKLLTDVYRRALGRRDLAHEHVDRYERMRNAAHTALRSYLALYFKYPGVKHPVSTVDSGVQPLKYRKRPPTGELRDRPMAED